MAVGVDFCVKDPQGTPLFDPDDLRHPRSAEWDPPAHIAQYLALRVRKPLSKETRRKLRAECPRPLVPDGVCKTPEVDPQIIQFLSKTGWKPRKALEFSLRNCQDKLLDTLGPVTKLFELLEAGKASPAAFNFDEALGWLQRLVCLTGNANSALCAERRKSILIKIEPKLVNMATKEPGQAANGLLFGDSFVKDVGSFVKTFTALDKAQSSMKRVFAPKVFAGAGRSRGRSSGRGTRFHGTYRGSFTQRQAFAEQRPTPFFPSRGRPAPSRGSRGFTASRRPYGEYIVPFFSSSSGWSSSSFLSGLGLHYFRCMGIKHYQGLPDRTYGFASPDSHSSHCSISVSSNSPDFSRDSISFGKRCHSQHPQGHSRFCQYSLPRTKEGRRRPSGHQSATSQRFCRIPSFQNGGYSLPQRLAVAGGLDGEARSSGRLFHRSYRSGTSGPFAVPLGGSEMEIYVPAIRPLISPVVLHQGNETGGGVSSFPRCSPYHLPGRLAPHGSVSSAPANSPRLDSTPPSVARFLDQLGQVLSYSFSSHRISGIPGRLRSSVSLPSSAEDCGDQEGNQEIASPRGHHHSSGRTDDRSVILLHPGHIPGPPSLQSSSKAKKFCALFYSFLRNLHISRRRIQRRADLVVVPHGGMERQGHFWHRSGGVHRIGCQLTRLGSALRNRIYRWQMVHRGVFPSYQLPRTLGRIFCHPQSCSHWSLLLHSTQDGQRSSRTLHQSPGWHEIQDASLSRQGFLEILPSSRDFRHWGSYSRPIQLHGGLELALPQGLRGLASSSIRLPQAPTSVGADGSGFIRVSSQHPAAEVFQLETRSRRVGHRRFSSTMASGSTLCVPSIQYDCQDDFADASFSDVISAGDATVEVPTLVSQTSRNVGGLPPDPSSLSGSLARPGSSSSQPGSSGQAPTDRMVHFRGPWSVEGVSQQTLLLLADAWAPGTRRAYSSAWRSWSRWCLDRSLDPVSAPLSSVLSFLTDLFENQKAYRTVNLYRSAISAGHVHLDGVPIGQHPLICRLLRGIPLSRPPLPRYSSTWDVDVVLRFLENWPPNPALSLKQLSAKLLLLFCVLSCKRVSDVRALDFFAKVYRPDGVLFDISRRTKTNIKSVFYPAFPHRPLLCPVLCLREYELRTQSLRDPSSPPLFISFKLPHCPVSTSTLSRWLKWILQLAGIDMSIFSPHSVRGASASKASSIGCRMEDILKAADWSSDSTFKEFYLHPVQHFSTRLVDQL
ncbi:uncharacterized protein LOC128492534 [Spea bombifrons]|uniref:uncharacterized protein LOC128492534 n=1 Tax=Spea bombifrons TaxID=233779 RepID=UPI002349DA9C|nr:uncharacterized protein LOC128492534 [Spea bombifrons]